MNGWVGYFLSEWPGFTTDSEEYVPVVGNRAVVLVGFSAPGITRDTVQRAQMWWRGIPVFGAKSDELIIHRDCYASSDEARANLPTSGGTLDDSRPRARQGA